MTLSTRQRHRNSLKNYKLGRYVKKMELLRRMQIGLRVAQAAQGSEAEKLAPRALSHCVLLDRQYYTPRAIPLRYQYPHITSQNAQGITSVMLSATPPSWPYVGDPQWEVSIKTRVSRPTIYARA